MTRGRRYVATTVAVVALVVAGFAAASAAPAAASSIVVMSVLGSLVGAAALWAVAAERIDRASAALERGVRQPAADAADGSYRHALARLTETVESAARSMRNVTTAANTDPLTGVPNRAALVAQLGFEIERAKRHARPLSVAFFDIDRFKPVNDTYGHQAGDAVLRGLAQVVRDNVRMIDTFGRYGGEEFLLVLPETDAIQAAETAERLRQLVMKARMSLDDGRQLAVTVSIGVAGGRGRDLTVDALVRDADAAMYAAKTLGRNQVYVYEVPSEDGVVLRAPIDPATRELGRSLGRSAREAAEARLLATLQALDPSARPGRHVLGAALDVGRELGMSDADLDAIRAAALFHDAGMGAIPHEIVDRPRQLDAEAWHQVRQHPRVASLMLEEASRLREAAEIVLHHHERYAGHGYPNGLRGSEIPLGARVLAVVDAYSAMREERPHRRAMSHEAALAEIERHAGTQFDPHVAATFQRLFSERAPDETSMPPVDEVTERRGRRSGRSGRGAAHDVDSAAG